MNESSMAFTIYLIHELANSRNMTPGQVYRILKNCGCIDNYLVPNYDVLHTMSSGARHLSVTEVRLSTVKACWLHRKISAISRWKKSLTFGGRLNWRGW